MLCSMASDSVAGMAKILQTLESKEHALKGGELAKLLRVTRQHIYKMAAASAIPSFRIGAAVRFDPKQVAEWLTRRMPQTVTSVSLSRLAVWRWWTLSGSNRRPLPCHFPSRSVAFKQRIGAGDTDRQFSCGFGACSLPIAVPRLTVEETNYKHQRPVSIAARLYEIRVTAINKRTT
jgi:excisionase family DNA binding protein